MTASAVPDLMLALVEGWGVLFADVTTTLGAHLDETPGARLWVGFEDPASTRGGTSARSNQSIVTNRRGARDEVGEVACALFVERGDDDMPAAVLDAQGVMDELARWLATDALTATRPWLFTVGVADGSMTWTLDRSEYGAGILVQFSVGFTARLDHTA